MIDHLISKHGKQHVAYIYCDYRDQTNQTVVNILGSLLKQLLTATSNIPDAVTGVLELIQKEDKRLEKSDISQILKLVVA